jgi:hypothetical protein
MNRQSLILIWAVAWAVAAAQPAWAQTSVTAQSDGSSDGLVVTTTRPVAVACETAKGCFRLFIRIRGSGPEPVGLAFAARRAAYGDAITDSSAIFENGTLCAAYVLAGLPFVWTDMAGSPSFESVTPALVSSDKSATLVTEFRCDGPVVKGSEVSLQFSLAVLPGGRLPPDDGRRHPAPGRFVRWTIDGERVQ